MCPQGHSSLEKMPATDLVEIDDEYETKMAAFESDCNDGEGVPAACHQVGEFYAIVKEDYERAKKVYERNCNERNFSPSCFHLAKLFCKIFHSNPYYSYFTGFSSC